MLVAICLQWAKLSLPSPPPTTPALLPHYILVLGACSWMEMEIFQLAKSFIDFVL